MEVNDTILAHYVDAQSAFLERRLARETPQARAALVKQEILLMLSDWNGTNTKFLHHLAQYGITDVSAAEALAKEGLTVLYQMTFASLEGRKGVRGLRQVYQAMGLDEAFIALLTLLIVELILREPADDIDLSPATAQQAHAAAAQFMREYQAGQRKPLPEQLL